MMSNEAWKVGCNEEASNRFLVAALQKFIVRHCKNQQYQITEATWRNFCLKVADVMKEDFNTNEEYNPNKIINYVNNDNDIDFRISYSIYTNNQYKVCIYYLKFFLSKYSFLFSFTELCTLEPSFLIRSISNLTICKDYLGKDGCHNNDCKDLHCCKYYILESCKFADNCSFGHNLSSGRNKEILNNHYILLEKDLNKAPSKYHLNNTLKTKNNSNNNLCSMIDDNKKTNSLTNTETTATTNDNTNSEADKLKKNTKVPSKTSKQVQFLAHYSISDLNLVLRRDCPRICRFYNSDPGCKYGADGKKCPALHLCREVVMSGECTLEGCHLNHSIQSSQVTMLLSRQGFIINEYTKETSIFAQLKASEEASENINPNLPNKLQGVKGFNVGEIQQYDANGIYENSGQYDNYEEVLMTQMTYFDEGMDDDGCFYSDNVYNDSSKNVSFNNSNNNEDFNDGCYMPVYYQHNYLQNNTDNSFYKSKENSSFYPSYSKESNKYYHQQQQTQQLKASSFLKGTPMTLRQQHLRQRKRIDNSRLKVCKYYNFERGCKFLSSSSPFCPNLHLCHHFVVEKCIYGGEKCRRSHNIYDPSVKWVLQMNNIDLTMSPDNVLEEIRRRLNGDNWSSESDSEEDFRMHIPSQFTTRSTLTPTASEFTPSKSTAIPSSQNTTMNNNNVAPQDKIIANNNTINNIPSKASSTKINTFVFLDLEATGFHQSKITELSLVAVHRSSILSALSESIPQKGSYLPRIINKLTICINPGKAIERRAAELTGIGSGMLDSQGGFTDHTADLIFLFLQTLEPPCCLVAHNGRGFDFPLLIHELSFINRKVPLDLYCIDSLILFRSLYSVEKPQFCKIIRKSDKTLTPSKALPITSPNGTPIYINKDLDSTEDCSKGPKSNLSKHLSSSLDEVESSKSDKIDWWGGSDVEENNVVVTNGHHDNKISPNKLSSSTSNLNEASKKSARTDWWDSEDGEDEDEDEMIGKAVKKSLKISPGGHEVLQCRSTEGLVKTDQNKVSYKLAEVHKRVTGEYPQNVHRAEDDSEALLRCFIFTEGALEWTDHNAMPFTIHHKNSF